MASTCEVCGKHPSFGHSISHSHRRTKRRWNEHPAGPRPRQRRSPSARRLHVLPQGGQGHQGAAGLSRWARRPGTQRRLLRRRRTAFAQDGWTYPLRPSRA
ncbi:MAG: bL28 family ribosomal protein [Acidimicrobiales bacterium]